MKPYARDKKWLNYQRNGFYLKHVGSATQCSQVWPK